MSELLDPCNTFYSNGFLAVKRIGMFCLPS